MSGDFGTGKTIFVLAIVVGCFAVLWPKIFYPMLTASVKSPASARQAAAGWKNQANSEFLQQLCYLLEEHSGARWSHEAECWLFLESACHLELNESMLQDYRLGKDKTSFTDCLGGMYRLSPNIVAAAVPPKVRPRSYTPQVPWSYVQGDLKSVELDDDFTEIWADLKTTPPKDDQSIIKPGSAHHVRPERPAHLYPEMMHPALREKGRVMPQRTVDKNPRPGPMPGMRPTMGGAGGIVPPPQGKGSGAMGIIMPLYTVGIVVFFVYTIMKVLFKKGSDDDKAPKLKDFGMDPEYRKYVFAEEYLDNQNISTKSEFRRQQREDSRQRRKMHEVPDTKIEDEQMDHLRRRLEDTEVAMERLMNQMGSVTDKLTAAKITEVLSQAQAQAKILKIGLDGVMDSAAAAEAIYKAKDEAADLSFGSDDMTTSEALTTTMSDDTSFPSALHRHLQDLQNEGKTSSKDSSPDMEEYEVIKKEGIEKKSCERLSKESSPISTVEKGELQEETENKSSEPASTTINSTDDKQDDTITPTSHKEEADIVDTTDTRDDFLSHINPPTTKTEESLSQISTDTAKTDEPLSQISPAIADSTDKDESDISDSSSTVESKKEVLISEKVPADDLSSTKPVIDEKEKSIGKVEE